MSTLSDRDIRFAIKNGELIRNGDQSHASGACYELKRMGDVYYDLTEDDKRRPTISGDEVVLIKPAVIALY